MISTLTIQKALLFLALELECPETARDFAERGLRCDSTFVKGLRDEQVSDCRGAHEIC